MEDGKTKEMDFDDLLLNIKNVVTDVFSKLKEGCKKDCDQKIKEICETNPKVDFCLQIAIELFERQIEHKYNKSIAEILISIPFPLTLEDTKSEERNIEDKVLLLARLFFEENWLLIISILKERHGLT